MLKQCLASHLPCEACGNKYNVHVYMRRRCINDISFKDEIELGNKVWNFLQKKWKQENYENEAEKSNTINMHYWILIILHNEDGECRSAETVLKETNYIRFIPNQSQFANIWIGRCSCSQLHHDRRITCEKYQSPKIAGDQTIVHQFKQQIFILCIQ